MVRVAPFFLTHGVVPLFYSHYAGHRVLAITPSQNWRIFLEQSFTACVSLLMQLVHLDLGEDARVLNGVTCTASIPSIGVLYYL